MSNIEKREREFQEALYNFSNFGRRSEKEGIFVNALTADKRFLLERGRGKKCHDGVLLLGTKNAKGIII